MGLMDVLGQYARQPYQPPPTVHDDFGRVAQEAPEEEIASGLEEAFRTDETPPFEEMVSQLYDRSDDDTRAGLLDELAGSLRSHPGAGGAGAMLGGGTLGGLLGRMIQGHRVSPTEMRGIPPHEVQEAAAEAARRNPGVLQKVSQFYARHPQVVQALGQAALGIMMRNMARRRRF